MKKYIFIFIAAFALSLSSCEDELEPGGTVVEKLAGDWWVTVDVVEDGTVYEDGYGIGYFKMFTYNTAANLPTEMWLEDGGHFWDYKSKVAVDNAKFIFSTPDWVDNQAYESKIKITDGKILLGAATTPTGAAADSIYYKIQFDDDGEDGSLIHIVHGFRRTGFPADDF
jgi:hypothetical protein